LAPTIRFTMVPLSKRTSVGTDLIPYVATEKGFASTSTLATVIAAVDSAIACNTGANALQGPHHVAQKSIRVGFAADAKYSSMSASVSVRSGSAVDMCLRYDDMGFAVQDIELHMRYLKSMNRFRDPTARMMPRSSHITRRDPSAVFVLDIRG